MLDPDPMFFFGFGSGAGEYEAGSATLHATPWPGLRPPVPTHLLAPDPHRIANGRNQLSQGRIYTVCPRGFVFLYIVCMYF